MYGQKFSLMQVIKDGLATFFRHIGIFALVAIVFFAVVTALTFIIASGYVWLIGALKLTAENITTIIFFNFALSFIMSAISTWLLLGNVKIALNAVGNGHTSLSTLFKHFSVGLVILQLLLQIVATLIFYFVGVQFSQILLLILLLIGLALFGFVAHFIVDRDMNVVAALRHSFTVSKRSLLYLILLWGAFLILSSGLSFARSYLPQLIVSPAFPVDFMNIISYFLMQPLLLILTEAYIKLVTHRE